MSEIGQSIKQLYDNGLLIGQIAREIHIETAQVNGILFSEYGIGIDKYGIKPKKAFKRRTKEEIARDIIEKSRKVSI